MNAKRAAFLWLSLAATVTTAVAAPAYIVYVGTYTGPKSKGIYAYNFGAAHSSIGLAAELARPSWLALHPSRKYLYAVSELGGGDGAITSFSIDPKTGALKQINQISSAGGGPCHLEIDRTGRTIFVANYGTGSVAGFRIRPDGSLGERTAFDQHSGSGANPQRQRGPHAHEAVLSLDNRFLFVPDLGLDKIFGYRFDASAGTLSPNDPPFSPAPPGSGPRHFAFHPNRKFAYAVCEMGSEIVGFSYDARNGHLRRLQTVSTLPAGFHGDNTCAEIAIEPGGRFLYASNRGNDSIAVFAVDPNSGTLDLIQHVPSGGRTPRNFAIHPAGNYLLAANQDSDSIVTFKLDPHSGKLSPHGQPLSVPSPVSIVFLPLE